MSIFQYEPGTQGFMDHKAAQTDLSNLLCGCARRTTCHDPHAPFPRWHLKYERARSTITKEPITFCPSCIGNWPATLFNHASQLVGRRLVGRRRRKLSPKNKRSSQPARIRLGHWASRGANSRRQTQFEASVRTRNLAILR